MPIAKAVLRTATLVLLFGQNLAAQSKVLGRPVRFESPVDCFGDQSQYQDQIGPEARQKSKKDAWLVISDRDENPVYEKPDITSTVVASLHFRDYFYVVEEDGDWVKIVDAQVDELKIINLKRKLGWVPKKKLLLWNSGIVGRNTLIHKKALLLNRADDIKNILKLENKSLVEIFRAPESGEKEPDRTIFEFYFILKKESGRFLLCEEAIISPYSMDRIVGWVNERRCSSWDNRICLEPNFDENAFAERANNPRFKLRAFQDEESAQTFAETNQPEAHVFWKDDPVDIKPSKLAPSNPRRYNGYVLRFPMLGISTKKVDNDTFEYFRSGIVGNIKIRRAGGAPSFGFNSEISEADYSRIKSYVNDLDHRTQNVNIFFVIEGTDSVFAFRKHIAQSMRDLRTGALAEVPNVRFGAMLFRDIPEESVKGTGKKPGKPVDRLIETQPLTADLAKVASFVESADFKNRNDRDEYSALYFGLNQSVINAGFVKNEMNIVFLIGNYGDYRADRDRKSAAKAGAHKTYSEDFGPLFESLNELDAHFYAIQLRREASRPNDAFARQAQFVALETAKFDFNKYYGNRQNPQTRELLDRLKNDYKMEVAEPNMADVAETNDVWLVGGRNPSRVFRPAAGQYLSPYQLTKTVADDVRVSVGFERTLKKVVDDVFLKGNNLDVEKLESELKIDAGSFAPALAEWLNQIVLDDKIAQKDLLKALDDKYKLYTEVYLPHRIKGADHPTTQFVLFMPESDLNIYLRSIQRALGNAESSYDKKRDKLVDIYTELIAQFSGENLLRDRKADDFTRSELVQLMQGLYGSGLRLDVPLDVRIGDIRNERKVTNEQIDELLARFKTVEKTLSAALRAADQYDFCFSSDALNRYYWIPLSDAF